MASASRHIPESPRGVVSISLIDEEAVRGKASSSRRRKSVSFLLDDSCTNHDPSSSPLAKVKCYYAPIRAELSQEETDQLYWNKKFFKSFKKESKKLARTTDEEKHRVYLRTFMTAYSYQPRDEHDVGVVHRRDLSCLPLATASVRGLERYIFPGLSVDQRRAKATLLKAQTKIADTMPPLEKAFILASTSAILSRQARHIARLIGHADSVVALSIYKHTFLPSNKGKR
jgi:hypothetical protein